MAKNIDLEHKLLASGRLLNDAVEGDFFWDSPGWTGASLYTVPTGVEGIACSGTDVKLMLFHNTDDLNDVNIKTYFHATSEENRSLNINIPHSDTMEWDFGYIMHLNTGESIYGNAGSVSIYGGRHASETKSEREKLGNGLTGLFMHKTGFVTDTTNNRLTLSGHNLADGDGIYLETGIHGGTLPGGLATGVAYFVSVAGDDHTEADIQLHANEAGALSVPPTNPINLTSVGSNNFELYKNYRKTINYHIYGAESMSGVA